MGTGEPQPLHANRRRASSFGDDAEQYDRARPSYPPALVDALLADGPTAVLDVGCGTGIVGRLFLARGCTVQGIEPDARMATVARRRGEDVEESTFESWDPAGRRFDLLVAGQSWHWVDPAAGARKATDVLRPGGRIGLFWNQSFPSGDGQRVMDAIYGDLAPDIGVDSVLLGRQRGEGMYELVARSLQEAERFVEVRVTTFHHDVTYSTPEWLDLAATHSDHRTLPPARLEALLSALRTGLDEIGGSFPVRYETGLVTGRTPPA